MVSQRSLASNPCLETAYPAAQIATAEHIVNTVSEVLPSSIDWNPTMARNKTNTQTTDIT